MLSLSVCVRAMWYWLSFAFVFLSDNCFLSLDRWTKIKEKVKKELHHYWTGVRLAFVSPLPLLLPLSFSPSPSLEL